MEFREPSVGNAFLKKKQTFLFKDTKWWHLHSATLFVICLNSKGLTNVLGTTTSKDKRFYTLYKCVNYCTLYDLNA